jgi:hypothetical protein
MTTLPDDPTQQPDDAPAGTAATPQDAVLTEAAAVMAEVERKLDVSLDLLDAPGGCCSCTPTRTTRRSTTAPRWRCTPRRAPR